MVACRWQSRAGPGCSFALQPCLRAPLLPGSPSGLVQARGTGQGLGRGLLPQGPRRPLPFLFLLIPTLFSPQSGRGKNAVSSEQGPRVTGGGSPSYMAPGVRDPLLRPRLHCPCPCLRLCPPGPIPYNLPRTIPEQPLRDRQPPGCPSLLQVCLYSQVSWPWPPLATASPQEEVFNSPTYLALLSAARKT